MPATRRLIFIIIVLFLLLLVLVVPGVSWSQTPPSPWQEPAREFSKKIVALTGPRQTVTLSVRNISSLSDSEVAAVSAALETELRAVGLRLATKINGAPELRITLSENLQGFLWIAEFLRDGGRDVAMVAVPKVSVTVTAATTQRLTLQSKLIYEQDEPILDFGFGPSDARLFVVGHSQIAKYAPDGGSWKLTQSDQLPQMVQLSRDPIADLRFDAESFWLLFAGFQCHGGPQASLPMMCSNLAENRDSASPQKSQISPQIVPGRNFYRSLDLNESEHPLHYGEVWLYQDGKTVLVKTGLDGAAWILRQGGAGADEATKFGWGSQLGIVKSGCGKGTQLLVTAPGDWTDPDTIQAVEFDGVQPISVAPPLLMPGPVMKLNFVPLFETALAVVHNLKTNRYEAHIITLSCGH